MTMGRKCPQCGLLQMPGPTCKSCGAPLGGPSGWISPPPEQATTPAPAPISLAPSGFSKGEAIRFGWETMKANIGFFIGLLVIVGLVNAIPALLAHFTAESAPLFSVVISLGSWFLNMLVQMGLVGITLRLCDGERGQYADLFALYPLFFKFLLGSILYGLIVMGGTLLLVVPGIIWGIKYMFFAYFIVDKGVGPGESIRRSGEITRGIKGDLFVFGLLLGGINLLGALCLFLGLFATIPATMVAMAYAYRRLSAGEMR